MKGEAANEQRPPMEIAWSRNALARLREIRQFVAADKPVAAERLVLRILSLVAALRTHAHLGRAGAEPGTRELVIGGTPYIAIYKAGRKRVTILTIWHGAQQRRTGGQTVSNEGSFD